MTGEASGAIGTPLGPVIVTVTGTRVAIAGTTVARPTLPPGMAVDGAAVFRATIAEQVRPGRPVRLHVAVAADGFAESGEWLESLAVRGRAGALHVAVRDGDWLAGRGVAAAPVVYHARGLVQVIRAAPAGTMITVGAAWRLGAGQDESTWSAADLILPG